jgi:hypothetical protein
MESYIPLLAVSFATVALVSGFYWLVARPILMKSVIYRLFSRRDHLRRVAINGEISADSEEFQDLEAIICKTIDLSSTVTLGSFLLFSLRNSRALSAIERSENLEPRCEAAEKIKQKTASDAFVVMVLNSPLLSIVLTGTALVLWVAGKLNSRRILKRTELAIESMPLQPTDVRWA